MQHAKESFLCLHRFTVYIYSCLHLCCGGHGLVVVHVALVVVAGRVEDEGLAVKVGAEAHVLEKDSRFVV